MKCKIKIKNITKTKITSKVFHKQNVKCWVFVLCFYASSLVLRCLVLNFWHGKQSSLAPRRRRRGRICCWKLHYACICECRWGCEGRRESWMQMWILVRHWYTHIMCVSMPCLCFCLFVLVDDMRLIKIIKWIMIYKIRRP